MSDIFYINSKPHYRETIRIKNMLCDCCKWAVRQLFEKEGIIIEYIEFGNATILIDPEKQSYETIRKLLDTIGLGLIGTKEEIIVEEIKRNIIDLIHRMNNVNSIVQKSDYLVEKMGMSYQKLSRVFSQHEPITLEKFIILNKIERIKELINQDEFTFSEIAYMMDYSSVHYLSNQFKKITGYSVSDYKSGKKGHRISISKL